VSTIAFRGKVNALKRGEKTYVCIYVYAEFGGNKLSKYVGKEVSGLLVVEDEGPQDSTH
jgi:hypothetical protein